MSTPYCQGHGGGKRRWICLDEGPDLGRCGECGLIAKEFTWMRPEGRKHAIVQALMSGLIGFVVAGVLSLWVLHG